MTGPPGVNPQQMNLTMSNNNMTTVDAASGEKIQGLSVF